MSVVDPAIHPTLPAGRRNDGRYLFFDEPSADLAYRAMSQYRK